MFGILKKAATPLVFGAEMVALGGYVLIYAGFWLVGMYALSPADESLFRTWARSLKKAFSG